MAEHVVELLSGIPAHWITFFLAMLPVLELRASIPWALLAGDMSWQSSFLWSIAGNFVPIVPILLLLDPAASFFRRWKIFDRFFEWLFARTRRKGKIVERYEFLGLIFLVAIPLPGTGAWTGALAAFVFGVRFWLALPAIVIGVLIAGILVTSIVMGGSTAVQAIFGL
ncbi:small multi-drug export protein [bacterium]|nr:small multi-drug export protein [bacterium]MBU1653031.1 small multi-drug export protein [bacterium]MBU1881309.1 small multi-drug export protein [bacterium]